MPREQERAGSSHREGLRRGTHLRSGHGTILDMAFPAQQASEFDTLPSAAMATQYEAARYLGVSPAKVGWLVFRKHLDGSRHGVTVGSVRKEKQWRATASAIQKIQRALHDALWTILDGL